MTLYDQTKMTDLKHTTTVVNKRALPAKIGIRYGNPMVS